MGSIALNRVGDSEGKYDRQERLLSEESAADTTLIILGAHTNDDLVRFLIAGAACAGVGGFLVDAAGKGRSRGHWFYSSFRKLVRTINSESSFSLFRTNAPLLHCMAELLEERTFIIAIGNGPQTSKGLTALVSRGMGSPVIQVVSTRAGFLIQHFANPSSALRSMTSAGIQSAGSFEIDLAAAGASLSVLMHDDLPPLEDGELIAFYSLHRERRVNVGAHAGIGDLLEVIVTPATSTPPPTDVTVLGGGALGNWATLVLSQEPELRSLTILDFDHISQSNLSRQILFAGPGQKVGYDKARVLPEEINALASRHVAEGVQKKVETTDDIHPHLSQVTLALPDNDLARTLAGDAVFLSDIPILFASAGTEGATGQITVCPPDSACHKCSGISTDSIRHSCSVSNDSISYPNMVMAGILISEIRRDRPANICFNGDMVGGNRLMSRPLPHRIPCTHRKETTQ